MYAWFTYSKSKKRPKSTWSLETRRELAGYGGSYLKSQPLAEAEGLGVTGNKECLESGVKVGAGTDCLGKEKMVTGSESGSESCLMFAGNHGGLDNFQQCLRVSNRWRIGHFAVYKLRYTDM